MSEFDEIPPLPDGARETERITIRGYLNPDGSPGYTVHSSGDAPATSFLGLMAIAERDLLRWATGE